MGFDELLRTRRSVHQYNDEVIEADTLESIFEATTLAPSGYNLQPWEFLVLREDDEKATLREIAYDQAHVTEADTAVVVLGHTDPMAHAEAVFDDWLAKEYLPNEEVRDSLLENVAEMSELPESERRVWTTRSTSLAAMTLMYAAWSHGVASCPMEGFDSEALSETFEIPGEYEPVMLVTLGYPAEGASDVENERKGRRPVEEIVHYGGFEADDATTLSVPSPGDD
ncbi:MAG: nitroreductase [Natronomonas sp.]|jgi:nitroreductase